MKQLKLLLLLSALFGAKSSYAAAAESKDVQGLDEVVATALPPRVFTYKQERIEFAPELYTLSQFMKNAAEVGEKEIDLGKLSSDHYLTTLGVTLQEIHALLQAILEDSLPNYLDRLPMAQVLKIFELASFLNLIKEKEDITETLADYIVNRTINTPANRRFAASAITYSLNTDLEKLLKKRFDAHPERFRHIHAGRILNGDRESVAFNPNSTSIASRLWGKAVNIWNTVTQNFQNTRGHISLVESVAFSPNGSRIASGSRNNTIKIWDPATGAIVRTLNGHTMPVASVAYSPDGSRIASGSWDNTIKIWAAATGAVVGTLRGHTGNVASVAYSSDGSRIASGSDDSTIKIWDTATGAIVHTLNGHTDCVTSVAYSPDGSHIASGSEDRTIKIWDVATGQELSTLRGHARTVASVAFSPDRSHIASGSYDDTIKIWDAATGTVVGTLRGHTGSVYSVAYSPDGSHIASGSEDRIIKIWDAATGAVVRTLNGHASWVTSVAYSSDGSRMASGSYDRTVRLWDMPSIADAQLAKMYTIAQIESDVLEEQIKNASQNIVKNRGLKPFISGSGAFQIAPLPKYTKSLALSVLKRKSAETAAPSAAAETASAATVEPESFPAARPQYYDTLLPAYSATAEPEDNAGFSQDEIAQAITNSLQEQTRIPAPSGMAAAAEVSTEVPAEDTSAQPRQYPGGPSIHEEKDNGDDEQPAAAVAAPAPPVVRQLSQEELRAARIKKFGHLEKKQDN
jgi:WD40 repeat protein